MDVLTPEQRRKNMQAIKGSKTKIEQKFGKALWAKGYRYRRNSKTVFGKPDFVFKRYKIAIFCDGDYWHGKDWEIAKHRIKTNTEFWHNKIESNIRRDAEVNLELVKQGWTVLRFWESEIKKDLDWCIRSVEKIIIKRIMRKYSDVKSELNIEIEKDSNEGAAYLTHYFQNNSNGASKYFKKSAVNYLSLLNKSVLKVAKPEQYFS